MVRILLYGRTLICVYPLKKYTHRKVSACFNRYGPNSPLLAAGWFISRRCLRLCGENDVYEWTLINRVSSTTQANRDMTRYRSIVSGVISHRVRTRMWISLSRIVVICYNRCPWMSPGLLTRSTRPSVRPSARHRIRCWCWPVPAAARPVCWCIVLPG